jgi:hypothetical protein
MTTLILSTTVIGVGNYVSTCYSSEHTAKCPIDPNA